MTKYSLEFRENVMKRIKEENLSLVDASKIFEIDKTTAKRWSINPIYKKTGPKPKDYNMIKEDVRLHPYEGLHKRAKKLILSYKGLCGIFRKIGIVYQHRLQYPPVSKWIVLEDLKNEKNK
jgi:transposase